MSVYRILIGLDELLDTRYGTLCKIDPELAKEMVGTKEYVTRVLDVFSLVDKRVDDAIYRDLYLKRDEETLSLSVMTDIPLMLGVGLKDLAPMYDRGVLEGNVEIVLNTYPYKLSDDVHAILEAALDSFIPSNADLTIVYESLYNLTPGVLESTYLEWYCYDIEPWMAIHQKELLATPNKSTEIHVAKISTSGEMPEKIEGVGDPFKAREFILKHWLNVNYVDARAFSVNVDFRKKRNMEL